MPGSASSQKEESVGERSAMQGTSATVGTSDADAMSSSAPLTNGGPRKQVQVVGAPPAFHGNGRKTERSTQEDEDSDGEREENEEEERRAESEGEDAEEIQDSDLLDAFPEDEESIDLTHLRLTHRSLRKMPLKRFAKLQRLCLRQNEIAKFTESDIGSLTELRDLDLYDNALEKTYGGALQGCPKLETLDLSFNAIHHISNLSHLANLSTLFLVQNKISRVRPDDLAPPLGLALKSLELGGNRLRTLENIGHLTNLEELWVGKNKLTSLEGISTLSKLRILSIQSNRITKIEGLDPLHDLEELYLSHNGLEKIEGLEKNTKLTTLDVGANKVQEIEGLAHLKELEEFWANDNAISNLNQLDKQLGPLHCPKLNTVYLEGNPAQKNEGANYRRKVKLALPQIQQIDATYVR